MTTRDRLPKAQANHLPSLTVAVEHKHAQPAKVADNEATEFVWRHGGCASKAMPSCSICGRIAAKKRRTKLQSVMRAFSCRYRRDAHARYSLVEPPDPSVFCIQRKHPHNARRRAVRSRMTMLNEARADYQSFPVGLAAVLRTLTHDRTAMLRYVAVRLNVTDARQLPRDSKQRWIKVQR